VFANSVLGLFIVTDFAADLRVTATEIGATKHRKGPQDYKHHKAN